MNAKNKTLAGALVLVVLSCGTAMAAGDAHVDSGVLLKDFLYRLLNFSIVVAILVYFLKKPIGNALSGRRDDIEKALAEAKKVKEEAEAKFAEYDKKLNQATQEIAAISASIRKEAEMEKQKIIENAREQAVKIEQDAEKAAALEVAKARLSLQQEAVQLAVGVAEDLLKKNFTKDDDSRLIDEYMQKVGELH
ncbi:F0F1 ATP synthase subunit B [Pelovirga terrestris]|uniref:ATP synthase subunit b n=1 Tax=Pelovirga terrestris TaxID=2771352 RepID=A0A8J6UQW8_9BACT|nr:F0F1 ATP synthase subunit B [Pelovirga terrestris]MBD1399886.1 F0F1 ATP synthase subunit B [Pelovirga terrestris]